MHSPVKCYRFSGTNCCWCTGRSAGSGELYRVANNSDNKRCAASDVGSGAWRGRQPVLVKIHRNIQRDRRAGRCRQAW